MKKYLSFILLLTVLVSGCSQAEFLSNELANGKTFTASFEQNESRTYIEEGNLLRWTAGDQITLFDGNTLNRQYKFDGETGANAGTFSIVNAPYGSGNDLTANYAVYPFASDITITENGVFTTTLPAEQSYVANSFGLGANTMVAVTENTDDTFLKFQNVGGYLKLQLYGDDVTVKSITLTGNNNEKLAGKAIITSVYGQTPIVEMSNDATKSITLDCGNGVKIGSSTETARAFWFVIPPTTFESGFTITITDLHESTYTKSTSNKIIVERNIIKPMNAFEAVIQGDETIPYLTFTADAAQSLTMSMAVATLEYSVNGGEWKELGTNTVMFGGNNGKLRLRGQSSIGTCGDNLNYSYICFGNDVEVSCTGDIRTLIDYENHENTNTSYARFCFLFRDCTQLKIAPELPITALAKNCYYEMFYNCTSLTAAPQLPATTLTTECYFGMFSGCSSLTIVPELPATTLKYSCYNQMFRGCTSLKTAPKLPATTLDSDCYYGMFKDCTSLTTAPELPAMTLAKYCYQAMFSGCTSLIIAPQLPATTLATECYLSMFRNCTSLTTVPEELPATTLTNSCYKYMFSGCTSLTTAPKLPATTLTSSCYDNMFYGCTKLNSVTMLATNIKAQAAYSPCLENWLYGVSATGTFIKNKEIESSYFYKGAHGIPKGWAVKDYNVE